MDKHTFCIKIEDNLRNIKEIVETIEGNQDIKEELNVEIDFLIGVARKG